MRKKEIKSTDGRSIFRLESSGKVRLILMPEDRSIIIGQINDKDKRNTVLLLHKQRSAFEPKSYTLGVPYEVIQEIKSVQTVAIQVKDTGRIYCVSRADLFMYGLIDMNAKLHRQTYLFLDFKYWSEVSDIEGVLNFYRDSKAIQRANKINLITPRRRSNFPQDDAR